MGVSVRVVNIMEGRMDTWSNEDEGVTRFNSSGD